jgi:hypothetical protein
MIPAVLADGYLQFFRRSGGFVGLAVLCLAAIGAHAATPYREATVTRTQNKVSYGELKGDRSDVRPAAIADVVRANNFLQTETDSRAELKYEDGSLVRIGQNTIFSFEAITRTLTLGKGSMLFYVPKGSGGANIKTPSLTAAITGTVGKVAGNYIAILEGSITLKPSGRVVSAGEFVRKESDGSFTIDRFDPAKALDGALVSFNGKLPVDLQKIFGQQAVASTDPGSVWKPDLSGFNTLERTNNLPGAQESLGVNVAGPTPSSNPPPKKTPTTQPTEPVPPPDSGTPVQQPF